jgi:hypothetical protein
VHCGECSTGKLARNLLLTAANQTKLMTCRYAHKRVALLFTAVLTAPAIRVIDWPQKQPAALDQRNRRAINTGKSAKEIIHAND